MDGLGFANVFSALTEHPIIGLLVFGVVTALALSVLSEGRLGEAVGGIFRVLLTIFTTPFTFLRDALNTVRTSSEEEQHYERTRLFMLFRYNRIQYLLILIVCLLVIASGVTGAVMAMYPQAEIEASRSLNEQVRDLRAEIEVAEGEVTNAGAPGARQQLQTRRDETQAAWQQQVQSNLSFIQNTRWTGPLIDQMARARSQSSIDRATSQIDSYMFNCPRSYSFQGFTQADCDEYRNFLTQLADRRSAEFRLELAAQEAANAFSNVDMSAQNAQNRLADLQQRLEAVREARDRNSLLNPRWIIERGLAAIGILLATALWVIIIVWLGALLIDFFNWLILIMRAMEKRNQGYLDSYEGPRPFDRSAAGAPPNYPTYPQD